MEITIDDIRKEISKLSDEEKIQLVADIWDDIAEENQKNKECA